MKWKNNRNKQLNIIQIINIRNIYYVSPNPSTVQLKSKYIEILIINGEESLNTKYYMVLDLVSPNMYPSDFAG